MSGVLGSPGQLITSLDEDGLQELYTWIDEINLSRPKRNIWRDFSDGGNVIDFQGLIKSRADDQNMNIKFAGYQQKFSL